MKRLIISVTTALIALSAPLSVSAQEFDSQQRAVAAIKARDAAIRAGDYKTACSQSHVAIEQTALFMGEFKAIIDESENNTGVDRDLLAQAKVTYEGVAGVQATSYKTDKEVCAQAGMAPAP